MQAGSVTVIDVDWSRDYIEGHIPGARYGIRARLGELLAQVPSSHTLVMTSADGLLARLAAADVKSACARTALALVGGTAAWRKAGHVMEQGATHMATAAEDIRLRAREQNENVEAAMQAYLSWEINLVNQMAVDDDQRFRILGA
jgi:3-mercaptopyruvate sulfurtransferase SseA